MYIYIYICLLSVSDAHVPYLLKIVLMCSLSRMRLRYGQTRRTPMKLAPIA